MFWLNLDDFHWDFQDRAHYVKMTEMRGHNPILASKLYILFNILTPLRWISLKLSEQGSLCQDDQNKGSQPYTNLKTVHFVQYLDSLKMNFLETCRTGFVLSQGLKRAPLFVMRIERRGHKPILTSKLYILINILTPFRWIFLRLVEQGSFCQAVWKEESQTYTNFKTVYFV